MQRDMKWDVTCCTVTSASLLAILCLASGRSEDTRFTDTSMEQHPLLIQWSKGRFTPLSLSAATRVSGKAQRHVTTLMVGSLTQHCDAFSTRKEHHDQSTDARSGGRPPDHSEKRGAPHHRLSAASSELDRLDGSSYIGREYCGHSPPGEGLCVAHRAFYRQRQDWRGGAAQPPPRGRGGGGRKGLPRPHPPPGRRRNRSRRPQHT